MDSRTDSTRRRPITKKTIALVVGAVLLLTFLFLVYLFFGIRHMEYVCGTDKFVMEHFGLYADPGGSIGLSLWPPGIYCENEGHRVVQLYPH